MKIEARLTHSSVRHDQDTEAFLVLSLTAPETQAKRPRLLVLPVIDVSGSMAGPKLEYAKRSALKLIDHLRPEDYIGIIAFESSVHVVAEPSPATAENKDRMRAAVSKLHVMGGTNLAGGMLEALDRARKLDLPEDVIHRVILFTDGQANEGVATTSDEIIKLLNKNAGRVTLSAFGYGRGTEISQDFLMALAKAGKGNFAYVEDPDAALNAFGKELGGLLSSYATDLAIDVTPLHGHKITKVISDVDSEEDLIGEVSIKVADLLTEEVRHIVLGVKLAEQKAVGPRSVNVFDVKLRYSALDDGRKVERTGEAKARVQFVKAGEEQAKPTPELDAIVGLAQVVRAQLDAEALAKAGNYQGASQAMNVIAASLASRGLSGTSQLAHNVGARLGSASMYASNQTYLRTAQAMTSRAYGVSMGDSEAMADVQGLTGVVYSNSVMGLMEDEFTSGDPGDVGAEPQGAFGVVPEQATPAILDAFGQPVAGSVDNISWSLGVDPAAKGADSSISWAVGATPASGAAVSISNVSEPNPEAPVKEKTPAKRRTLSTKSKSRW